MHDDDELAGGLWRHLFDIEALNRQADELLERDSCWSWETNGRVIPKGAHHDTAANDWADGSPEPAPDAFRSAIEPDPDLLPDIPAICDGPVWAEPTTPAPTRRPAAFSSRLNTTESDELDDAAAVRGSFRRTVYGVAEDVDGAELRELFARRQRERVMGTLDAERALTERADRFANFFRSEGFVEDR